MSSRAARRICTLVTCGSLASLGMTGSAAAQGVPTPVPQAGEPVFSMGQPPKIQLHGALMGLTASGEWAGRALVGAHKPFFNPVAGALGVTGEAFAQQGDDRSAGLR